MAGSGNQTEQWSSRVAFLFAAIGFSVGLGNIWRFPYIAGAYGGSAFIIIYLLAVIAIGLPLLIAELTIGRCGQGSPTGSIRAIARNFGASQRWGSVGTLAIFCVFIILSYYTVLTGWTFDYLLRASTGAFEGISQSASLDLFDGFMKDPLRLLFWHTLVSFLIVLVVRRGVQAGIEKAAKVLIPALFLALIILVAYGSVAGDMVAAVNFMLTPDFSKVTIQTVLVATGQAFFSIGIGMGALITFGGYLPKSYSIPGCAVTIIIADTGVALLAGFAIFPLVFAYGFTPSGGTGLIFHTLPVAFGEMTGGQFFAGMFFVLLVAAALSSCIGCGEALTSWVDETWGLDRKLGAVLAIGGTWLVGLLTIMSLGDWSDIYPLGFIPAFAEKNVFETLDFLAANILLLLGALLVSIFFGWLVPKQIKLSGVGIKDEGIYKYLEITLRFVIPPILLLTLLLGIAE